MHQHVNTPFHAERALHQVLTPESCWHWPHTAARAAQAPTTLSFTLWLLGSLQAQLTQRAVELLALPPGPTEGGEPRLLLDLGCGSGLSSEILSDMVRSLEGADVMMVMEA